MLDDHDGQAVREQAVEDSEKGLHAELKQTARIAENSQLAGRFRRWWQVMDSNHRRRSRRFYRPLPLAARATCLEAAVCPAAQRRIADDAPDANLDGEATRDARLRVTIRRD